MELITIITIIKYKMELYKFHLVNIYIIIIYYIYILYILSSILYIVPWNLYLYGTYPGNPKKGKFNKLFFCMYPNRISSRDSYIKGCLDRCPKWSKTEFGANQFLRIVFLKGLLCACMLTSDTLPALLCAGVYHVVLLVSTPYFLLSVVLYIKGLPPGIGGDLSGMIRAPLLLVDQKRVRDGR